MPIQVFSEPFSGRTQSFSNFFFPTWQLFWNILVFNVQHLLVASLIAQLVKNPPAMQETLVQFLGLEDPLEKG